MSRPFTYGVEAIPWEQCARMVQNQKARNRPLSSRRVDNLARAVECRRFYMTHQGVALNPAGEPIDGQHRLAAHAKAKTDYVGLVIRYTDGAYAERVMAVFDSGRSRTTADGLAIGGIMKTEEARDATAVCNVMCSLFSTDKVRSMDLQEVADFYRDHRDAIQWSVANVPAKRGGSYVRAAFAVSYEAFPEKTAELSAQIDSGVGLPGTAAALWNRAHADGLLTCQGGRNERRAVALRALRILKAHVGSESAPTRLFTDETALLWFLSKVQKSGDGTASPRLSPFETRILKAIPKTGARLGEIAKSLSVHPATVRGNLQRMKDVGVVTNPERGFYVPVAA